MVETSLVYIYQISPRRIFRGCGALVEGGYVATCRHVWDAARSAGEPVEVEAEFPYARENGAVASRRAILADSCEDLVDPVPDLVLLKPVSLPDKVAALQLAGHERFEVGEARSHTLLWSRRRYATIDGTIDEAMPGPEGLRQFSGGASPTFWFEEGSSGSPVFLKKGMQLAGIVKSSEVGSTQGSNPIHVAFVIPGTTIRAFLARLAAAPIAEAQKIDAAELRPILERLGAQETPLAEIPKLLMQFVEQAQTRGAEPVPASNEGADIEAAIISSRAKLGALDTAGALQVLQAKIAEEEDARRRRLVPLLKERAAIERLSFDYDAAKSTLAEVARLDPDDVWALIDLGDLYLITGPLVEAESAFRRAIEAARRQENGHDRSVSLSRLGDVQRQKWDLSGALKSFSDSLAIRDSLSKLDPGNADWQRYLSVLFNKVGDVQLAQGDLASALQSYSAGLDLMDRLTKSDPANMGWQRDFWVSFEKVGDVQKEQGDLPAAMKSYSNGLSISDRLAKCDPGNALCQFDLGISNEKIGDAQLAKGDFAAALKSYEVKRDIVSRLANSDSGNVLWQRDLSVSLNKVGDAHMLQREFSGALKSYSDSLAIIDRLAQSDPSNALWQNDLSVSLERIGVVQQMQGELEAARRYYFDSLAIRDRLAKADPGNELSQRGLSISYHKVGDIQKMQGDLSGALQSYSDSFAIADRLAKADPGNMEWQRDLIVSCVRIADCAPGEARAILARALDIATALEAAGRLAPRDAWIPADLARRIAELPEA